jgi:hypothetical protein
MYDIEIIKKINKTDPELARLMISSRDSNRPSNTKPSSTKPSSWFKRWLHETDPWAFRVSDAVFTLAVAGLGALAFVLLPVTTALLLVPLMVIVWMWGFVLNH